MEPSKEQKLCSQNGKFRAMGQLPQHPIPLCLLHNREETRQNLLYKTAEGPGNRGRHQRISPNK